MTNAKHFNWKGIDWDFFCYMAALVLLGAVLVSLIAVMGKILMFMVMSPNW